MTTFFTSDTHFLHKNIIRLANRPWCSREEMYEALIDLWNEAVGKDDEVYHFGDVSMGSAGKTVEILKRLNGKKYLLWGNHDSSLRKKQAFLDEFEWCRNYAELKVQDADAPTGVQRIVLCHYPLYTWNHAHHGSWMLHGHCHGNIDAINESTIRLDVGVDSHDYRPISYDDVKRIMSARSYDPIDIVS
jgi:calcineurin-like phosphoesterase family protein